MQNNKSREQLIAELDLLSQRVVQLEAVEQEFERTKAAMQETAQRYFSLFDSAGDAIFIIDPRTSRILEANANAARRLRYSREEFSQLMLSDIEVPRTQDSSEERSYPSTGHGNCVYECNYRRKDGSLICVEVSSRFVTIGGREVIQNFVRDISQRKMVESEREKLITELNAFAHTVAHDLKNPLATVHGYVSILASDFEEIPHDEMRQYLRLIEHGTAKMANIIDELLLLASVRQRDQVSVNMLNMGRIVAEAQSRLAIMIEESGAEIIIPAVWPKAWGYGPWVEEVWTNYLSNGLKYGGKPPRLELGADIQPDHYVRFWVRDNGAGVPPEKLHLLFSPFTQLDDVRAQGHGLGLSIVQHIVERLSGQVGVESQTGQGSLFWFSLPTPESAC